MPLFLIIFIFAVVILLIPTLYGFLTVAPIFYSPKDALREALKLVGAKPGEKFYDLGAGSGRAMIIASKEFNLDVSGFELSPIIYWLAKVNLFANGAKNSRLFLRNFYNRDLSDADIIFCFLTPPAMEKLRPKFEKELKKGARIISYSFRINGWPEHSVFRSSYPGKVHVYIKQ